MVAIVPYDTGWPALYAQEAARIACALGQRVLQIEHVGSTSVPELPAKAVIDILLAVADSADESAYVPALAAAGYTVRIREPEWYQHRLLNGPDTAVNLHVFSAGCEEIGRMLLFRDWLRGHAEDRELYARTKIELAARAWESVQAYADAKTAVVAEIIGRASAQR
jgi:GrpB-like predicted nucleotidyltransferase (UPF0157 family)